MPNKKTEVGSGEERGMTRPTENEQTRGKGSADTRLEKIWSRQMALRGLKRIVELALDGACTEIRDEDGALVEVKFNPQAAGAATKAIEVANRMLGYTAPDEAEDEDRFVTVELGNAEEFAL